MTQTNSLVVKHILPAIPFDMGGFPVKQALPTQQVQECDPFLLLHHAYNRYSQDRPAKIQGVGPHPHRGFSPVTFVVSGDVTHRDSRGHHQVAQQGDVQWMHAGMGVIHSERPSQALVDSGQPQEIVQLWVNSPAVKKCKFPVINFCLRIICLSSIPLIKT